MPKDIHSQDPAQQRASRLLLSMGVIVLVGALAYFGLTLVVNRRTPANPDTHYTAENGISVDGVISPRKVRLQIDGASVTAVRCDIQAYYAVLATVEYSSGDVIYISALTKLASISDIVNLAESVTLS